MTDEQLMQAYTSGDEQAFTRLFKKYHPMIRAYVLKRTGNEAWCDEIVQEIFLKLHNSRSSYNSRYRVSPWIYSIAKSVLLDHFRKDQRRVSETGNIDLELLASPTQLENTPDIDLSQLSDIEKKAIQLRYEEDMEFQEIGEALNKSESNVRKIISRALQFLRNKEMS